MKYPPLHFFLTALLFAHLTGTPKAIGGEIQDLTMKKSGQVKVSTASYGEMIIIPVVNDVSTGTWRGLRFQAPFEETSGMEVEGKGEFEALDGQPVTLQVGVNAKDNQLSAQASWVASRPVKGHGRLDLLLSRAVIGQLIGSNDGAEVDFEKPPGQIKVENEFHFLKKSDGKPVMRLVFPEGPYKISFVADGGTLDKNIGPAMIIRISPRIDSDGIPSLESPSECVWQLILEK